MVDCRLDINFRYTVDCLSPGQRHWPEDLTWHPDGHSLFACYTADNGDSQVAIIKNDNKQVNSHTFGVGWDSFAILSSENFRFYRVLYFSRIVKMDGSLIAALH